MKDWNEWERKWWNRGMNQDTTASLLEAGHSATIEGADMTEETMDRLAARILLEERIKEKPELAIKPFSVEKAISNLLDAFKREGL